MANLKYLAIASLDGYIEDEAGDFSWAMPDEEVHAFVNDLMKPAGTYLYGRRMYEVMSFWDADPATLADSPLMADFARVWQAAEKVVYSRTLESVSTGRTRLERNFEPEAVQRLKRAMAGDIYIAGPDLAASAFRAGLVDECQLFLVPWLVGGGKKALPDDVRTPVTLKEHRSFAGGVVYLRYAIGQEGESHG